MNCSIMLDVLQSKSQYRFLQKVFFGLCLIIISWLIFDTVALIFASAQRTDAFFVLGGSVEREIYVANLAKENPKTPVLISSGSEDPCIRLIFQEQAVSELQNVWLEKCANSTFGNFYYGIPIFKRLGVHKVKLITSGTQVLRAKLMAQILMGTHGIWVEMEIAPEYGIPANQESWLKTGIDVTRSLLWAPLSLVIYPQCPQVVKLIDVDINQPQYRGFKCEHHN